MEKIILYRDDIQVNINSKDLQHWLDRGWSENKEPKQEKRKKASNK